MAGCFPSVNCQNRGYQLLDYFVVGLGTTGTVMGAGQYLKEKNPGLKIIGVEPTREHRQQGLRNMSKSRKPDIFDPTILDQRLVATDEDAFRMAKDLCRREGILAGISSGSALWAALEVGRTAPAGSRMVVIFPDRGEKYLSTELFPE
ncbi:MAG: pyridoxal-phosphate dependent enzyme [Candidatus Omnitrophica bacterium]|nr:pyridoxal-phosphate dependent enzyme [Candidatus Omnitrophota bacterium]